MPNTLQTEASALHFLRSAADLQSALHFLRPASPIFSRMMPSAYPTYSLILDQARLYTQLRGGSIS